MEHSFDTEIATEYGVDCAILLKYIYFWIEKNRSNQKHFHDGKYWTYNTIKAFSELFPYISEKKIRNALKKLESNGMIVTGNYNKLAYDRTTWYAVTEKGKTLLLKRQIEYDEKENEKVQKGKPIPFIKTDIKPDNTYTQEFELFWKVYPLKKEKPRAFRCFKSRLKDGYSFEQLLKACKNYAEECKKKGTDKCYIKHCSTFLSKDTPFIDYLDDESENQDNNTVAENKGSKKWQ